MCLIPKFWGDFGRSGGREGDPAALATTTSKIFKKKKIVLVSQAKEAVLQVFQSNTNPSCALNRSCFSPLGTSAKQGVARCFLPLAVGLKTKETDISTAVVGTELSSLAKYSWRGLRSYWLLHSTCGMCHGITQALTAPTQTPWSSSWL